MTILCDIIYILWVEGLGFLILYEKKLGIGNSEKTWTYSKLISGDSPIFGLFIKNSKIRSGQSQILTDMKYVKSDPNFKKSNKIRHLLFSTILHDYGSET